MFKVLLKHLIYEQCINVLFEKLYNNFVRPDILWKIKIMSSNMYGTHDDILDSMGILDPAERHVMKFMMATQETPEPRPINGNRF